MDCSPFPGSAYPASPGPIASCTAQPSPRGGDTAITGVGDLFATIWVLGALIIVGLLAIGIAYFGREVGE